MAISSPGIGSNLDVNGIVSSLMQVENQPLANLTKKEASYQAKLSAYGNLKSALSGFQGALSSLKSPSLFNSYSAVPADSSIYTASAASSAVAGTYNVNVTQLAAAQTIATAGQASTTAAIGSGTASTLTFQFGTITGGTLANGSYTGADFDLDSARATATVKIDGGNNSLQGIRDAVNAANIGVTASIVSDGSANPHHLVFTSNKTGASSSMKISVAGEADLQNLLGYDPAGTQQLTQSSAAQSAKLTVNGIAVTSNTGTVSDAVQGVTLNLTKTGSSVLTVSRNTGPVQTAVNGLIKAYNDLNTTIGTLTAYDAETKRGGPLVGDSTVRTIEAQLRKTLSAVLPGQNSSTAALPQIGIAFQKDGTLSLDSTKFQAAMTSRLDDIAGLFATVGRSTDSLVSYVSSSSSTKPGSYPVTVTALATRGSLAGTVDLNAGNTVIADDTAIAVSIDGTSAIVALPAGTYTAAQFASMLQSAINSSSTLSATGAAVTATIGAGGRLEVLSSRYGSSSKVNFSSATGTAPAVFIGAAPTETTGTDVAGTIGGATATGSGQTLSAPPGSDAYGLKLQIAGGTLGSRGLLNFSQGHADRLDALMESFTGSKGLIAGDTGGLDRMIKDIGKSRDAMQLRLVDVEKRYRAQFTALDVAIASMTKTSSFLTQQLAQLSANNS